MNMGERVMLRECRDGEQFGELALLEESPSPFTRDGLGGNPASES